MAEDMRLMAVLAHPDDESLGAGGALAKYAAEGVATHVVTATRGEQGRHGEGPRPSPAEVGRRREAELRAACVELGVSGVDVLGYPDGELDRADPREAVGRIVEHLRRVRPHVVITFAHDGAYGHPDHIAISQLTAAAAVCAADPGHPARGHPHRVDKLYQMAWGRAQWELYQRTFKRLVSVVDGMEREATPWPDWAITTRVAAHEHWETVWRAVRRHRTQLAVYGALDHLTEEEHRRMWGDQTFYRAFSTVNGGSATEADLFEGLRHPAGVGAGA